MVEAPNPRRLHPTSISYVYKVFWHLDMLWMGLWLHPYTLAHDMVLCSFWKIASYTVTLVQVGVYVTLVQVGVDFKKIM